MTSMQPKRTSTTSHTALPLHSTESGTAELARLISGRRSEAAPAQLLIGTLAQLADSSGQLPVTLQNGDCVQARQAASCLLAPQLGDLVQLLVSQQRCWIVQVLERCNPHTPQTVDFGSGTVHIQAAALHLQTQTSLHLQAQDLHVNAESLHETALRKQSDIQGWFTTRAAFVEVHADRQLNLFGGVTTLVSEALLKVDGAQIHLG
jgi:hypothetical protein